MFSILDGQVYIDVSMKSYNGIVAIPCVHIAVYNSLTNKSTISGLYTLRSGTRLVFSGIYYIFYTPYFESQRFTSGFTVETIFLFHKRYHAQYQSHIIVCCTYRVDGAMKINMILKMIFVFMYGLCCSYLVIILFSEKKDGNCCSENLGNQKNRFSKNYG